MLITFSRKIWRIRKKNYFANYNNIIIKARNKYNSRCQQIEHIARAYFCLFLGDFRGVNCFYDRLLGTRALPDFRWVLCLFRGRAI